MDVCQRLIGCTSTANAHEELATDSWLRSQRAKTHPFIVTPSSNAERWTYLRGTQSIKWGFFMGPFDIHMSHPTLPTKGIYIDNLHKQRVLRKFLILVPCIYKSPGWLRSVFRCGSNFYVPGASLCEPAMRVRKVNDNDCKWQRNAFGADTTDRMGIKWNGRVLKAFILRPSRRHLMEARQERFRWGAAS